MILIMGLGNPGKQYQKTRHNLGFLVLDFFSKKHRFAKFKYEKALLAKISQKKIGKNEIILAKPQTFMNASGKAAKLILKKYKIDPHFFWIIHDDLAIPFGKIKISFGKSSGGHKGVESIIEELKSKEFVRFRVGIGNHKGKIKKFVLEKFTKKEEKVLRKIIKKTIEAIEFALKEGIEKTMSKFN